jgi:hypothetical protein
MTGQRTTKGDLTADALVAGECEQYAVKRSYGTVVVALRHDKWAAERVERGEIPMPWVAEIVITKDGLVTDSRTYSAFRLNAARQKFKQLVRQHP